MLILQTTNGRIPIELTDIKDIVFAIEKLETPEILEYRDRRYRAMMKKS